LSWPDLAVLSSFLANLSTFGELYTSELDPSIKRWLPLLEKAGWITLANGDAYRATNAYLALMDTSPKAAYLRRICFAIPAYRRYLMAVLVKGLVQAGQLDGYHEQLEQWIMQLLPEVAGEINRLLDELEADGKRMVEREASRIATRFVDWHAEHEPFTDWDRALLGLSGNPDQLFTAVLGQVEAFETLHPWVVLGDLPVALLPEFELTKDSMGHLVLPTLAPWSTAREFVCSSLPFFDAQGDPLYNTALPIPTIWQNALAQQPYYRAVLRIAIAVRMSGYAANTVNMFVSDDLDNVCVFVNEQRLGTITELLPPLVEALGYRALSKPLPSQAGHILEHWIEVGAMEVRDSQICLREKYAQTLHERCRAGMLLRGAAREEQKRVADCLKGLK
jgi:hypothetical protein